jgi:diadenosine tetraphosphate (Ap4A) HIT family hydrolase
MTPISFDLDPRLAADTAWVCDWPVCVVLLMKDKRYPWLILVPRRSNAVEAFDLSPADQASMWREVTHAAELLKHMTNCRKINVGALGNVVSQLHVHVVARNADDAAGAAPVWGHGKSEPYGEKELLERLEQFRAVLRAPGS